MWFPFKVCGINLNFNQQNMFKNIYVKEYVDNIIYILIKK